MKLLCPQGWVYHLASMCDNIHAVLLTQKAQCAQFLLRFHYVGKINRIFANVVELNLSTHTPP